MKPIKRPPLGLAPKWIRDEQRLWEIQAAIVRYYEAEMPIPIEWVEEYNQLITERNEREANRSDRA